MIFFVFGKYSDLTLSFFSLFFGLVIQRNVNNKCLHETCEGTAISNLFRKIIRKTKTIIAIAFLDLSNSKLNIPLIWLRILIEENLLNDIYLMEVKEVENCKLKQ
jgi:hypothetical protein